MKQRCPIDLSATVFLAGQIAFLSTANPCPSNGGTSSLWLMSTNSWPGGQRMRELPAQIRNRRFGLLLSQNPDDLLFCKPAPLHRPIPFSVVGL
jgi:hypothetical protein